MDVLYIHYNEPWCPRMELSMMIHDCLCQFSSASTFTADERQKFGDTLKEQCMEVPLKYLDRKSSLADSVRTSWPSRAGLLLSV